MKMVLFAKGMLAIMVGDKVKHQTEQAIQNGIGVRRTKTISARTGSAVLPLPLPWRYLLSVAATGHALLFLPVIVAVAAPFCSHAFRVCCLMPHTRLLRFK